MSQQNLEIDQAQDQQTINALSLPKRAEIALKSSQTEKDLIALAESSKNVTVIMNKDGRTQVHGMYMTAKNARLAVEKTSQEARNDATQFAKAVIEEEKRLKALITPEETRLQDLRDNYDAKVKREAEEKAAAERARIANIKQRIDAVRNMKLSMVGKNSTELAAMLAQVSVAPDYSTFDEFKTEFASVRDEVIELLGVAELNARTAEEKAAATAQEMARMQAELDALRAKNAERDAEQAKAQEQATKAMTQPVHISSVRDAVIQREANSIAPASDAQRGYTYSAALTANAGPTVSNKQGVGITSINTQSTPLVTKVTTPVPGCNEIINLVAHHYMVDKTTASSWLSKIDFSEHAA